MVHDAIIKVRYVETDQMGVVHHSNYFNWFEVGRTEFLKELGMSYSEVEKAGIMTPLIEANCSYKSGAKYEEELIIRTSLESVTPTRMKFLYKVIRISDNKLITEGSTSHTFTSKAFKPVNLKKENIKLFSLFESGIE